MCLPGQVTIHLLNSPKCRLASCWYYFFFPVFSQPLAHVINLDNPIVEHWTANCTFVTIDQDDKSWQVSYIFGIDPIDSYSISNGNLQRMEVQSGSIMMHAELSVTSYLPLVQGSLPLNGQTSSWFLLCKGGWGDEITSPLSPTFSPGFHFSFWSLELCSPPTKTYVRDIQI